jgi:hypothetical protein
MYAFEVAHRSRMFWDMSNMVWVLVIFRRTLHPFTPTFCQKFMAKVLIWCISLIFLMWCYPFSVYIKIYISLRLIVWPRYSPTIEDTGSNYSVALMSSSGLINYETFFFPPGCMNWELIYYLYVSGFQPMSSLGQSGWKNWLTVDFH